MKIIFFVMFCITQVYAGKNANNEPYFDALSFSRIMYAISQGRGVSVEDAQYAQNAILTQPCAQWILDQKDSSPPAAPQAETGKNFRDLLAALDNATMGPSQPSIERILQIQASMHQQKDDLITGFQPFETKREAPLDESSFSHEETGSTTPIPTQPIVVPPLPDTIKVDYEHKNACFETFKCEGNQRLTRIRDTMKQFVEQKLDNSQSRILYLWGPAGTGKTHCLVAAMRHLSDKGQPVEFMKADEIYWTANKKCGFASTHKQFIDMLGPNIFIDDLNSTNAYLMEFSKQLVLSVFDRGGKKIIITSNMEPREFTLNLTHEKQFYGNSTTSKTVISKEAQRLMSRFGAMATIINFNGINGKRHNWLDERYEGNGEDDLS